MPNPTPTVFVPYHAIDDLHARGTRALQPTAPTVTPGTLYCVTDEQKVERSNGTIWESYSSSTTLPTNIAYKDQANVFTQPQTIAATAGNPTMKISGPGASLSMYDTAGAVDARLSKWQASGGVMSFHMLNDTDTVIQATPLTIYRSGTVVTSGAVQVGAMLRFGGSTAGYPALRNTTIANPAGVAMMDAVTADAAQYGGIRAYNFISTGPYNNFADLTCGGTNFTAGVLISAGNLTVSAGGVDITGGGAQGNENYFKGVSHIRLHLRETSQPAGGQTFTIMHHQAQLIFSAPPDDAGMGWTGGPSMRLSRAGNLTIEGGLDVGTDARKGNLYTTYPIYPGRYDTSWTKQSSWWIGGHGGYGLYINTGLYLEAGVTCAGNISASTITSSANINVGGNLHNTAGYVYPGRADSAGSIQASWYLGSHGSYGLYTNTGLYVEGPIYPGSIECRAHVRWVYGHYLTGGSAARAIIVIPGSGANFVPHLDNAILLGASDLRWYIVYTANGIATTSDVSTKKDLQPSTLGLAFLERLPVHRFQYIDDVDKKDRIGFTVQDVESALVDDAWAQTVVIRKGEGPAALNYLGFVPVLTTAVQELSARLRVLEAKIG